MIQKMPEAGLYGVDWTRVPKESLRPFVDQEYRKAQRIGEREISHWKMSLDGFGVKGMPVKCIDASATGFRFRALHPSPIPKTGSSGFLRLSGQFYGQAVLPIRLVWAQKQASQKTWDVGVERMDLLPFARLEEDIPQPFLTFDVPGSGILVYLEHPLLIREWMRCEVMRMAPGGQVLLVCQEPDGVLFTGSRLEARLALPNLAVEKFRLRVTGLSETALGLAIAGRFEKAGHSRMRQVSHGLLQSGILSGKILKESGFSVTDAETAVDVQGMSFGRDSRRRVIGAFLDGKRVASLSYCLDEKDETYLRIEGVSILSEAEGRGDISDRLFGMVGRALLLSPFSRVEAYADPTQETWFLLGGFMEKKRQLSPTTLVLSRRQILWGWNMPWKSWWRCYRPMVSDLVKKKLLSTSAAHRLWVGGWNLFADRSKPWP